MRLEGKTAVVTGGGGGLGRAMAIALAKEGADVAVWDMRAGMAAETTSQVGAVGRRSLSVVVDVSAGEDVETAAAKVIGEWGRIDVLVNNAGICRVAAIEAITEADWDRVLSINLKGTFLCCRAVMGHMKGRKSGKIINLGSISGKIGGIAVGAHYAASKAAVMCFTKSLARELAPFRINVNAIAPGVIETDMTREITAGAWGKYLATIPLARIGRPEDVARVAVFLASADADYLTGEIIDVNGGQLMD